MEGILHDLYATAGVPHMLDPSGNRVLDYTATLTLPAGLGRGPMVGPLYNARGFDATASGWVDDSLEMEASNDGVTWKSQNIFTAGRLIFGQFSFGTMQVHLYKFFAVNRTSLGAGGTADAITITATFRP